MNYYDILLAKKLGGGSSVDVEALSVTENGTYQEEGKAYSPVTVNVSGGLELTPKLSITIRPSNHGATVANDVIVANSSVYRIVDGVLKLDDFEPLTVAQGESGTGTITLWQYYDEQVRAEIPNLIGGTDFWEVDTVTASGEVNCTYDSHGAYVYITDEYQDASITFDVTLKQGLS